VSPNIEELVKARLTIVTLFEVLKVGGSRGLVPSPFGNQIAPVVGISFRERHSHIVFKLSTGHTQRVSFRFASARNADALRA
jgi:hypothetical protein